MAVIENRFVCDLSKPVQAQALKGNVFSLDNAGSRISVLIYNNGQPATISGSITANCILPDGSTVNVNGSLTTEGDGSKAYVDIPQSCLLITGILKIAVKCTSSGVITTLAAIVANVYMTKTDNVITPSQQIITDWNAEISAAIAMQDAAIATQDGKIADLKSALSAETYNLWTGDPSYSFTRRERIYIDLPAGTYTISAYVTTDDTSYTKSVVVFCDSNNNEIETVELDRSTQAYTSFTLSSAITYVWLYSVKKTTSTGIDATYANIMIYTGTSEKAYVPHICAADYISRLKNNEQDDEIEDITNTIGSTPMGTTANTVTGAIAEHTGEIDVQGAVLNKVSEETYNIWTGNPTYSFTRRERVPVSISAGTYTVSAIVITNDTSDTESSIIFTDGDGVTIGSAQLKRGYRNYSTVTLASAVSYVWLYSVKTNTSTGIDATWSNIMISSGSDEKPYLPHLSAIDAEARLVTNRNEVPSYYRSHIDSKIATILANMERVGRHGFTFVFITDPHWDKNYHNSPVLIHEIMEKVGINDVICGGDVIGEGTKAYAENLMLDFINSFKSYGITFPVCYGNHDGNWNPSGDQREHPERKLSENEVWALIESQYDKHPVIYISDEGFNFYIDYPNTNTRVIFLDTGDTRTIEGHDTPGLYFTDWEMYADALMDAGNKNIIVMPHAPATNAIGKTLCKIANKYNARESYIGEELTYNFANATGHVYIVIGGHSHEDNSSTPETGGISWVISDSDSTRTNSGIEPTPGTINEQAFDVVTVDYETGVSYFVRIGRGSDRTIPST